MLTTPSTAPPRRNQPLARYVQIGAHLAGDGATIDNDPTQALLRAAGWSGLLVEVCRGGVVVVVLRSRRCHAVAPPRPLDRRSARG